jgi:hypothetical protein
VGQAATLKKSKKGVCRCKMRNKGVNK